MARVMEKAGARRISAAQPRAAVRSKTKPAAGKTSAASKVLKVVPKVVSTKKERTSVRPPAVSSQRATPVAVGRPRVEAVRVSGSEHGAAVSRTDHLKARFAALSSASAQIRTLKRTLQKSFFDIGVQLAKIRDEKLYEVKGYGSFESFVEREVDLEKTQCLRMARMAKVLVRDAALEVGLERASAAMAAIDGDVAGASGAPLYPVSATVSSSLPAHKR